MPNKNPILSRDLQKKRCDQSVIKVWGGVLVGRKGSVEKV